MGCLVLFALPFAAAGTGMLIGGISKLTAGRMKDGGVLTLMGAVFSLVGYGMIIGGIYGWRHEKAKTKRKDAHPTEPWRWREDWAQGRVDSQGKSSAIAIWAFAIIWNLISSSVFFALPQELAKGNKGVLVALIFPVIGAFLLFGALYTTLQRRKYGQPVFKLLSTPCVIGGQATGMIEIPAKVKAASGFKVRLQCVEKLTTGSGKNRSTRESTIWQDAATVTQDLLGHQQDKTGIPVQFAIPASAPEASREVCNPSIHWRLTVEADVPGVDLNETFELPVFRTADSPAATGEVLDATPRWEKSVEAYTPPTGSRVKVQPQPSGGCAVVFPAARNVGAILFLLVFAGAFSGVVAVTIVKKAPIIFPIVFGLFDALMLLGLFNMLLHSSRVEADANGVRLFDSWVFYKKESRYVAGEIADVVLKKGMQSGKTVYYDVQLRLSSGTEIGLGSSVPDGEHAAWIAAVIRQAVGVEKK
ncbi:MAG TPA: hypothetical protein VGH19_15495 [Verrucomicrobiae bacterium]